jgi:hypothetical protein
MPGLVPGISIHEAALGRMNRDGRDKPGHDGLFIVQIVENTYRISGQALGMRSDPRASG